MKSKAQIDRDNFYKYLMSKYNIWEEDFLVSLLTDKENELREELELLAE